MPISFHLFVQALRRDSVQESQIRVQHDPLASNFKNRLFDPIAMSQHADNAFLKVRSLSAKQDSDTLFTAQDQQANNINGCIYGRLVGDSKSRQLLRHRLLEIHFDLEAEVFDHAPNFGGWLARCREVAVDEDGVGRIEGEGLEGPKIMFTPSGNAKFGTWVEETEEAENLQTSLWCEIVAVLQRRACRWMEHVQWN